MRDEGDGVSLFLQHAGSPLPIFELRTVQLSVPPKLISPGEWKQLRTFDIDADGRPDLIAGSGPRMAAFVNRLPAGFEAVDMPRDSACSDHTKYAVGDFDADHTLDMLCFERGKARVWRGLKYTSAGLTWSQAVVTTDLQQQRIVAVADLDADGADELVVSDHGAILTMKLLDDELRRTQRSSVCGGPHAVAFDVDHVDGLDIAVECRPLEVVLATPGVDNIRLPFNGEPAGTADLDGDGTRELLVVDSRQLRMAAFDSTGYHSRGDVDIGAGQGSVVLEARVAAADLDGDGKDELIVARSLSTSAGGNLPNKVTVLWSPH